MFSRMSSVEAYVKYSGNKLKYYMFSTELPPLFIVGGAKANLLVNILRSESGSIGENGTEIVNIKPFHAPAVLVWIVASISSKPSKDLLYALMSYTPRSAVDLVFESIDIHNGYGSKPLIPYRKLYMASKIILRILKLHNYPVEVRECDS